jgi:hypothetical protein
MRNGIVVEGGYHLLTELSREISCYFYGIRLSHASFQK